MVAALGGPRELLRPARTSSGTLAGRLSGGSAERLAGAYAQLTFIPQGRRVCPPPAPSVTCAKSRCSVGMFWKGAACPKCAARAKGADFRQCAHLHILL